MSTPKQPSPEAQTPEGPLPAFMRPPPPRLLRHDVAALLLVVLLSGAAYLAYDRWLRTAGRDGAQPRPTPTPAASVPAPVVRTPASTPQAGRSTVYKCMTNGKTSYSDAPCPNGSTGSVVVLQVPPPSSPPATRPVPTTKAPAPMSSPPPEISPALPIAPEVASNQAECQSLDTYIQQLDAAARQPLSIPAQDDLRSRRQNARDRQFRLRCR